MLLHVESMLTLMALGQGDELLYKKNLMMLLQLLSIAGIFGHMMMLHYLIYLITSWWLGCSFCYYVICVSVVRRLCYKCSFGEWWLLVSIMVLLHLLDWWDSFLWIRCCIDYILLIMDFILPYWACIEERTRVCTFKSHASLLFYFVGVLVMKKIML